MLGNFNKIGHNKHLTIIMSSQMTLIEEAEGIPEDDQTLYIGGAPLDDEQSISECLQEGSTVDVTVKLLGGKVHGSLARAGKVRGQTPKVEKQEKRKKKDWSCQAKNAVQ
ncbi:40S ribosomal protein S30 [Trichonephila clavata]|uniref:40S ribosomal protein S30 n=1 Tax=Trichonephila clavata TaxID=2740835 RepID=A0A8X6FUB3_TRICU|nr:40S ribosomal protein S30 [Trichonephila clavata]